MIDPDHIACWQRLDERTTTSGRLVAGDVATLAAMGVRHVINLALDNSPGALADEASSVEAQGLRYTHIPVPFEAPKERHFYEFCAAYDAVSEPVHVHCIMNWRVSAFFYRLNKARGMEAAKARKIMERQWSPETSENEHAKTWASFIAG